MPRRILGALASLKLTVALFALSMVLIFAGTLAQVQLGVWQAVDTYFRSLIVWIDLQLFIPRQLAEVPIAIPFPGGFAIAGLMIVNLLAAHAIRFRAEAKRAGIIILHAGVIVLLLGEFVTGFMAEEGLMSIDVGGSSNYVEDIRVSEFVVVDFSDPDVDHVISVPASKLRRAHEERRRVSDSRLPFDVEVIQWHDNARLLRARTETVANQGVGLDAEIDPQPTVRGVDGARTDAPAAYIRLSRAGNDLGTWLVSADLIDGQPVEIDGVTYAVALRFLRVYKPYTLHLYEFRHDTFTGSQVARNFSSRVRLIDEERGTNREVVIWMNNPLRYRGETFYQASYKPDGTGTVLQVVRNPGAILPYIACILVGGGMTWHFLLMMLGFLKKASAREKSARAAGQLPATGWALPLTAGVLGVLLATSSLMRPSPSGDFDLDAFGKLPVSAGGRVKPMDTAARHVLSVAGGRQSIRFEGDTIPATNFLVNLMARPEEIRNLPVVRVDHPDVLALLHLRPEDAGRQRLSLATIEPHWEIVTAQASRAFEIDSKRRDGFQRAIVSLYHRVNTILAHSSMIEPYSIPPLGPDGDWQPFHDVFLESGLARPAGHPMGDAPDMRMHPALAYYITMMTAYSEGDAAGFNSAVSSYTALLERDMATTMRKARFEVFFNRAALFSGTSTVYLLAFLLLCGSLLVRMRIEDASTSQLAEKLRVSAVTLLWVGFIIHTFAIIARIYIQGRPPVTNLYSSAIFVGWAAVLFGLILERFHRFGVAGIGAASVGFATLIVAHNLGSDGDTMEMMQAVLDTNFWLATHVVTITLGYSATFLAGALAIVYILLGVFTRHLTKERASALTRMVYGVVCFALLLSFVGTVLGGIWADQSWGRFWGWDPKENGAALVVLITAIILHARWAGIIRQRGIMVLAVSGNIVTAWSWFGTNMLGIGLHSYGFMDSAVFWLLTFIASQLFIMSIGLIPTPGWKSVREGET